MIDHLKERLAYAINQEESENSKCLVTRLTQMRIQQADKCGCQRCNDLLSRLHNNGSFLTKEHNLEQWGLKFWSDPNSAASHKSQNTAHAEHMVDALKHNEHYADHLLSSELEWQKSTSAKCADQDNDGYWSAHYRDVKKACGHLRAQIESQ